MCESLLRLLCCRYCRCWYPGVQSNLPCYHVWRQSTQTVVCVCLSLGRIRPPELSAQFQPPRRCTTLTFPPFRLHRRVTTREVPHEDGDHFGPRPRAHSSKCQRQYVCVVRVQSRPVAARVTTTMHHDSTTCFSRACFNVKNLHLN